MKVFTQKELAAIYKAAEKVAKADGKETQEEFEMFKKALIDNIGELTTKEFNEIKDYATTITDDECYGEIAFLDSEQKQFLHY